jgi:hypothetical protein
MTKMQRWLAYCGVFGLLATLQMTVVTGDIIMQIIMFPIYGIIYGSMLFFIVELISKLMGRSFQSTASSNLPNELPIPSSNHLSPPPLRDVQELEFTDIELDVYEYGQLVALYDVLNRKDPEADAAVCTKICTKIGRPPYRGRPREFLSAYYRQLHTRLSERTR